MRGFPLNLNPGALGGEDGPPPGFPYFGAEKFEFGYGGPVAFHHEFFGAHPPPHPHGPPFSGPGNPGESLEFEFPSLRTLPIPRFSDSFRFLSIQKSGNDATDASTLSFRYIATEKNLARNFDTIFNLGYTRILSIEAIYRKQNLVSSSIAAIINIVAGR